MSQETDSTHRELRLIFPSDPFAVRRALESVLSGLRPLNLSPDDCGTVELVLAEVMNNVVKHAYADKREGVIELRISTEEGGLRCVVLDDGFEMPEGNPPIGRAQDLDCATEDLPESGFGWFLIRALAKDLRYHRADGRNRLSFRLKVVRPIRAN
ncbi:MAG: ATP-binding protein [Halocynthiibacter sp.]